MERIWSLLILHIVSEPVPAVTVAFSAMVPATADVDDPLRLDPDAPCDPSRRELRLVG
jgi:hypothetical protein